MRPCPFCNKLHECDPKRCFERRPAGPHGTPITHECENCGRHFTFLQAGKAQTARALHPEEYERKTAVIPRDFFQSNLDSKSLELRERRLPYFETMARLLQNAKGRDIFRTALNQDVKAARGILERDKARSKELSEAILV